MLLFLLGLSWGGGQYAWSSGRVIATMVIGVVTLIAFVLYGNCVTLLPENWIFQLRYVQKLSCPYADPSFQCIYSKTIDLFVLLPSPLLAA